MRGYSALRRGRFSESGATYFLTLCADPAGQGLTDVATASGIYAELDRMTTDGTWALRAATLMPDHIHLLMFLGARLTLSQCIGRLKARSKTALASGGAAWQDSFYDHKLAPDEAVQSIVHYIFMNPYRAGLIPADVSWPWFRLGTDEARWFAPRYAENVALPAWLG